MRSQRVVHTDAQRMELRTLVKLASEIIAPYWPMRTFIHHNALHGLESLRFEDALEQGQRLLGGQGYLPNALYRLYYREGRIRPEHVEAALRPVAQARTVTIGEHCISHLDVLRIHLLQGINAPAVESLDVLIEQAPDGPLLTELSERLASVLTPPDAEARVRAAVDVDLSALGRYETLASWCDRTLGTDLVARINSELIKWCAAFLDEGQATWTMPHREMNLYGAWKRLAKIEPFGGWRGIPDWSAKVAALPDQPEDAIFEHLEALAVPQDQWREYFTLHLAALPGWVGFLKWRADQRGYAWQEAYPASSVKYLAIRLFYERELVAQVCRQELDLDGTFDAIRQFMHWRPLAYFLRRERVAGRLPVRYARRVDRLRYGRASHDYPAWDALAQDFLRTSAEPSARAVRQSAAWRLVALAKLLGLDPASLLSSTPEDLGTILGWLDAFPESRHGPVWLEALERGYHDRLLEQLRPNARRSIGNAESEPAAPRRPQAQAVLCIDVRSELFRRHLEAIDDYETFGFAGFFICFIRYCAFGTHHETDQYPVIMKARNVVREIPRTYHGEALSRHRAGVQFLQAVHASLHDLKEHVITPYVMVESLGWLFALPFFGKTLLPVWYRQAAMWLKRIFAPPIATTLTVDKLSKSEAEEMVAAEQRTTIRRALRERFGLTGSAVPPELVESLRLRALNENGDSLLVPPWRNAASRLSLSPEEEAAFIEDLRRQYRIDRRWAAAQKDRITRTGFTLEEQVFTVETALRMMGLTRNFARFVLLLAHGSTSDNNPFEAALDCGACGGNEGKPNARLLAAMANRPQVRERLAKNGITIPPDTHFLAGQIDTTTDAVQVFDLEDVPPTHRKDLARLLEDLQEASALVSQERLAQLPDISAPLSRSQSRRRVLQRATDWSQVRPEWGLSRNAAFIIGRRALTKGVQLDGRTFLHSYDYQEDPTGKLLEILLTGPQAVTQWINMEHYLSTVDNDVYGSGSKIYHNVTSRVGVMFGTQSDLRIGLPWQTVFDGERPYHEPMRLLTIVEAPRARIEQLIRRHEILRHYYHNRWVHLVAFEREEGAFYRYHPDRGWESVHQAC